uniref:Uncharacterized protein n=1 Tax=Cacopsylla melanoneura TaxID=428564 RepID=A0A8D9F7R2_9HEMI
MKPDNILISSLSTQYILFLHRNFVEYEQEVEPSRCLPFSNRGYLFNAWRKMKQFGCPYGLQSTSSKTTWTFYQTTKGQRHENFHNQWNQPTEGRSGNSHKFLHILK